ncbi:MAG: hypothetical protein NVS2B16_16510 [Chloroflexota bacterium]
MPDRVELRAEKRELFGKKVGRLRRAGILPATVYGHNITPQSIQFQARDLRVVMRAAGTTQLLDLLIDDQPARPVLIRQTTIDAKRNSIIHLEFFQANLREKIHTAVPLHFVGESQADKDGGIVLHVLDHVMIESLPQDVPAEGIEVDITQLVEIGSQINAGGLPIPAGLTLLTATDETVVKVNPPTVEEVVEEAPEAATDVAGAPGDSDGQGNAQAES